MGWCGGCLAFGLVRGAVRHYCLGGCSALVPCARRLRPVWGARAGAWCRVFPVSPFPPGVSCAVCGGPSGPAVPYPRSLTRHSMRSVRSAGSVQLPFWFSPRVLCVCVRSRSRGVRAPPPLPWLVWRAHLARSPCWALVGPFHAVRAPPRVLPRSRDPFGLFGGGGGRSGFPPTWLGAVCSSWGGSARLGRSGARGWGGGGGRGPVRRSPRLGGWQVALPRFVPLSSLRRQQGGCPWRRYGHGGRGPHTAPVRARLLSPGAVRVAPWCVGPGSLVHLGS